MRSYRTNQLCPQILVIFLVALALLVAGARVPDLSRPHRPKATHRVVLEKTKHKAHCVHLKQHGDPVSVVAKPSLSTVYLSRILIPHLLPGGHAFPAIPPGSGRSPPAVES